MQERTIKLGNLTLRGFAALAPMAGVADRSMRRLCMEHGAAFCVGELASAKGIALKDKKSQEFLTVSADERPMGIQLFGCEPETMALAAISAEKNSPDFIDINMGCPAPKVVPPPREKDSAPDIFCIPSLPSPSPACGSSNGAGSALMLDEKLAGQIVAAVKKSVKCPVTVKMRSGWDDEHKNAVDLARICQNEGADMITVHGRTKKQGYRPPADLDIIARVKSTVKIPVIGNGDIMSPADAEKMLEYTGCDMVMVGRAANGNPWIFEPRFACDEKGEKMAMLQMRKHAAWYLKGIRGAALLRGKCSSLCTFEDLEKMVNEITEDLGTYDKDR